MYQQDYNDEVEGANRWVFRNECVKILLRRFFLTPDKVPGGSIVAVHWDVCQVTKDHIELATLLPEKIIMIVIIAMVRFILTKISTKLLGTNYRVL